MNHYGAHLLSGFPTTRSIMPNMDPHEYQTFSLRRPRRTHWRSATCEEADCEAYRTGWVTTVDLSTDLGQRQYHFITHDRERKPSMQKIIDTLVKFVYGPGFRCFGTKHKVSIDRPPVFLVLGGDWRGNPRAIPTRTHTKGELWVEQFEENLDAIRTIQERG